MKKIINNKRYDTSTATLVGEYESGYPNDFSYYVEQLYRKRTGEYFLYGKGNAASKYAESLGNNSWGGSEAIQALTYDAAREWAENCLDADAYEREFEVIDDNSETVISVRIPASARATLDRYCARTGEQKGSVIAKLLESLDSTKS